MAGGLGMSLNSHDNRFLTWTVVLVSLLALLAAACVTVLPTGGPVVPSVSNAPGFNPNVGGNLNVADPTAVALPALTDQLQTPATPTVTANPSRTTVAVRQGPIADQILLNGTVSGGQNTPLTFASDGRIKNVDVKPGQQVSAGQVLLEFDTSGAAAAIDSLRNRIDMESFRIQLSQQQVQQSQQSAAADSRTRRDTAVGAAQDRLAQAQQNQQKIEEGASVAQKKAAEGTLVAAKANLDRANQDLARLKAGPSQNALQAATQQVTAAQVALQKAQTDQANLIKGATPEQLQTAQSTLDNARVAFELAQANLDQLLRGPDQFTLQAAQRAVDQANASFQVAQAAQTTRSSGQMAKDAAVEAARNNWENARDRLAQLKQPPTRAALDDAKNKADQARLAVGTAQNQLDTLRKGPDQNALDAASSTVSNAQLGLDTAQQALQDLKAGASPDQINAAQSAVQGAQLAVDGAQAQYDDVMSHPTPDEEASAQKLVDAAQAALAAAQTGAPLPTDSNLQNDILIQQKSLQQDQAQLAQLQAQLNTSQLAAPFDGSIVAINVQPGEAVDTRKVAVVMTPPGDAVLRVPVSTLGPNPPNVTAGQSAIVQLDGGDGTDLSGTVASVADNPDAPGQIAQISVNWGPTQPSYGTTAQVHVALRQKPDAILVPSRAVRDTGDRHYFVDYVDASGVRQSVEVKIGIQTATDTEILSGLQIGQQVIVG
jgi:HlyD family secretion protein